MPQKDDFLIRLQEQLSRVLETAREHAAEGHVAEALAVLGEAQRALVGLDSNLVQRVPSADLLLLLGGANLDVEKCLHCAELLAAEHDVRAAYGEADTVAQKALDLYLAALSAEPSFAPHCGERLAVLTRGLDYRVPSGTQGQLVDVYTQAGRFDEAENWLYRWAVVAPDAARVRAEAFYRELLGFSHDVLDGGGLPRGEVEEGLANLTREPV